MTRNNLSGGALHELIGRDQLTSTTFLLHFKRNGFQFQSGQYVVLRNPENGEAREYSLYNGENDEFLSVLVRETKDGVFTPFLRSLKPGFGMRIEGPRGFFILDDKIKDGAPCLFIATGTGISPFHSMIRTHSSLNYLLLHGVRNAFENYGWTDFPEERQILCTSRDSNGHYSGRVTDYLRDHKPSTETICYLCGNAEMIEEASSILENDGISPENIRTEVFF